MSGINDIPIGRPSLNVRPSVSRCIVGSVLALPGCQLPTGLNSFVTHVELSRSVMRVGEEVTIHATNVGISDVTMFSSCAVGFRVYDADDRIVAPNPTAFCTADARRVHIARGDTYTITRSWRARRFEEPAAPFVEPGGYRIVGALTADGGFRNRSSPQDIEVLPPGSPTH